MASTAGGRRQLTLANTCLRGGLMMEIAGCVPKDVVVFILAEVFKGWGAGGCQVRRGRVHLHRVQGGKRIMLNLSVTNLHQEQPGEYAQTWRSPPGPPCPGNTHGESASRHRSSAARPWAPGASREENAEAWIDGPSGQRRTPC